MNCNLGVIGTHDWPEPIRRQCLLSITRKTQGQKRTGTGGTGTETSERNRDGDLNARSHPPSMAAQQFLPGLPDRALHHGRYHTSRSRHENTRCGDAFFSPKSEIEVSVPKQAKQAGTQASWHPSKLRTTRSLVTASGHQLYGSGRNRDRFGV